MAKKKSEEYPGGAGDPADAEGPEGATEEGGNIASPVQTLQTMAEAEAIWTTEAMEAAEPCDIIEIDEEELEHQLAETAAAEEREIAGGLPEDESEEDADELELQAGYGYPPPFTRWENFDDYRKWPSRCVGKLFFKRGSSSFVCSAASIGNCAIWTAGHCLHAGNNKPSGWSTNVVFVPAYKDGVAPFGQWPAKQLWVRTAWYKHGIPKGLAEDMGGATLFKQNGRKISQRVGWLGFTYNRSRVQHWLSHGYPAGSPFNGRRMQIAAGSYAYNGNVGANPAPVGMGNDLTGGSSGGPWIWRFGTPLDFDWPRSYLNGNNSYRRRTKPKEMFSPYFGNAAKSLYDVLIRASC